MGTKHRDDIMKISIPHHVRGCIILSMIILSLMVPAIIHAQVPPEDLSIDECSETEAWLPVGTGLNGAAAAAAELEGKLYVVYKQEGSFPEDTICTLVRLDGTTWTTIS